MPTGSHDLRRRGAIYHYRRRLPAPLKEILNRTYFDGSLTTADPARARRLARQISVALDQLSERLQGMPKALKPTPGQLNLVLKELFDSILIEGDRRRALPEIRGLPLAILIVTAEPVLGGIDASEHWMLKRAIGFSGRRPIDLIESPVSRQLLVEHLIRLAYGVYT